ncbi:MAG: hypothetical protein R3346_02450 [Candidatus Spechtbacterales bacterium]|nr:hypothetical protein [Candidatus Spechtbacterales bacterium]
MGKRHRINKKLGRIAQERGRFSEDSVHQALIQLRDYYNVPIIIISSKRGDHRDKQGVDIEIRGRDPLYARFGIDVKSSMTGVRAYKEKGRELSDRGIEKAYPSYPFLFQHEYRRELLLDLLRFILSKSKSHADFVDQVPEFSEVMFDDFEKEFSSLVEKIFN